MSPLLRSLTVTIHFLHAVDVAFSPSSGYSSTPLAIVKCHESCRLRKRDFALCKNIHEHRLRRIDRIVMPRRVVRTKFPGSRDAARSPRPHAMRPIQHFLAIRHNAVSSSIGITSSCAAI